jgi:hypothetical protein
LFAQFGRWPCSSTRWRRCLSNDGCAPLRDVQIDGSRARNPPYVQQAWWRETRNATMPMLPQPLWVSRFSLPFRDSDKRRWRVASAEAFGTSLRITADASSPPLLTGSLGQRGASRALGGLARLRVPQHLRVIGRRFLAGHFTSSFCHLAFSFA